MRSKICTICHKNESVWDNFGGICGQCMIEKELRENTIRHDSELLDKVMQKRRTIIDEDGVMYKAVLLKDIEDIKAEVSE